MKGILLLGKDSVIESRAKRNKVVLQYGSEPAVSFEKTLITQPGVRIPWELLPAAWSLLDRWDAAVPLWRYDVTAQSVGTVGEREETRLIIRDIRVLLHSYELLFVRRNETGLALVETWRRECLSGPGLAVDKRLAFLRALYHVKPRLCVLPTSWLSGAIEQRGVARPIQRRIVEPVALEVKSSNANRPLVTVELQPGRSVKCHKGDEEKVRQHFIKQMEVRHGGN